MRGETRKKEEIEFFFFFTSLPPVSNRFRLIVYLTDDPRARLSSYASANSAQLASYQESLDKLIDLIVATIDELITAFQQVRNVQRTGIKNKITLPRQGGVKNQYFTPPLFCFVFFFY
jgi:hypothetical protein